MCPVCITTVALSGAAASSGAGVMALAGSKWRIVQRWFCSCWQGGTLRRT